MVAISLSVRALLITVLTFAHFMKIERPVEDYAVIFKTAEKNAIAERIKTLYDLTHVQLAVLTVPSLGGQKIEVFSHRAATAWAGGSRRRSDGLLLVIAPKEHRIRLEVGAGLTRKLPNDRVKTILDNSGRNLKLGEYQNAVISIIGAVELEVRPGLFFGSGRTAVVADAVIAAATAKSAQSGTTAPTRTSGVQPVTRPAPVVNNNPLPPGVELEDLATLDSSLMRKFGMLLSFLSLILGMVYGRSRINQEPSGVNTVWSYGVIIFLALVISWFAASSRISPAVLMVTLVQAISGMRAAMASHLRRIIGPDDDYELIERASRREVSRYVLPGIGATLVLGILLYVPAIHNGQFLAIVGTAVIGVIHAIGLNRLDEVLAGRPVLPPGSYPRICTSSQARVNDQGEHIHVRDDSPPPTDANDNGNRGDGGTFNGDGATSEW